MRLGNGSWETASYNNRLQITQIGLGIVDSTQDLLKLEYSYGTATQNNGSLREQKITVPTVGSNPGFTAVQTYTYDDLNRIQSARETISGNQTWKQTFVYDRYGNRRFDMANTTVPDSQSNQNITNPQIDVSNNRFSANQGYDYDQSGNVTKDATDKRFAYDAENKQASFGTNGSSTNGGSYFYDGDGRRVKKVVGTETTIFVYNASGQLVAEYTTTAPTNPQTSYLTSDTLGSPRINTDANGQVAARHDYMPFGEEIASGTGGRTIAQGYGGQDNIRQKFTSYERDSESELDFAQSRYYSSKHGRFISVDPENTGARIANPQSWNGYAYASNNPLKYVDPDGLATICRQNGKIVSCAYLLDQIRQGNFETVTYTNSAGVSLTVRRADYYEPGESYTREDGTEVVTTNFNNSRFLRDAARLAGLIATGMGTSDPDAAGAFRFGGGGDFQGGGAGTSWDCPSCPAFNDDPYNPDVVRGRQNARNAGNRSPGSVPTPDTDSSDFEHTTVNGRKAFRNKETGEVWMLDMLHKDHYEVYKNKRDAEKGKRTRDVWRDGRPKREF
jgi:RHS repeat-associated protein